MTYDYAAERFKRTAPRDAQRPPGLPQPGQKKGRSPVFCGDPVWCTMQPYWAAVDAVRGGTQRLLELGDAYLYREPLEDDEAYQRRLNRAALAFTPWYTRLVSGMTGTIFRKPVIQPEGMPAELEPHLADLNLDGDNLTTLAAEWFESGVDHNFAGMLIDYPNTAGLETRRDERERRIRPYWVLYPGSEILEVQDSQKGSIRKVSLVRLRQTITQAVEGSEFEKEEIEQVLVFDLIPTSEGDRCRWRIFREDDEGEAFEHEAGITSLDEVPFVLFAIDKKKNRCIPPPMIQIAYLNLKHYQLTADLDHSLHIGHVPRQFLIGVSAAELGDIGSTSEAICLPNPESKVAWSVAPISSYDSLQGRIEKCELQMASLSLAAFATQKNVGETAEAKRLDRAQSDSIMGQMCIGFQAALNQAIAIHCRYMGIEPPEFTIDRDFNTDQITPEMIKALAEIANAGSLSTRTFLQLLERGELGFPDDWTVDEEIKRLEEEAKRESAPATLNNPFNEPPPGEEDPSQPPATMPRMSAGGDRPNPSQPPAELSQ